jgi:hypothetical protein
MRRYQEGGNGPPGNGLRCTLVADRIRNRKR